MQLNSAYTTQYVSHCFASAGSPVSIARNDACAGYAKPITLHRKLAPNTRNRIISSAAAAPATIQSLGFRFASRPGR